MIRGSKRVSFIVTVSYDLLTNIMARESGGGSTDEGDEFVNVYIDEDGNKVTRRNTTVENACQNLP